MKNLYTENGVFRVPVVFMPEKWKINGYWISSCNCEPGCPCLFFSDPSKGHCDGIDTIHITAGRYGKVKLDGLNITILARSPGNFWKGNWTAALYLDEKANPAQRQALETIMSGKAGGPTAMIASLISTMMGTKYVPIKFNLKDLSVTIPGVFDFKGEPVVGGDKKKPVKIENHPLAPVFGGASIGKGTKSHFTDYGLNIDNTGKDVNWAPVAMSGP